MHPVRVGSILYLGSIFFVEFAHDFGQRVSLLFYAGHWKIIRDTFNGKKFRAHWNAGPEF